MIGFVGIQYSDAFFEDGIVIEVPGQIMNMSQNVISSGETMFVDGSFKQPVDDFTANIFKDYEYSSKLVLTLSPSSNEFGDFNFNFTIPQDWELGNYHIVLENGLQFMDWEFDVRKNYSVVTLDRTVYPVPWDLSPLKQFKSGISLDDIQCKDNLVLIQKYNHSPVCVTPETKIKLVERGWVKTTTLQEIDDSSDSLNLNIARIEDGRISLHPENTCASLDLNRLTAQDIQRYKNDEKGLDENNILQITSKDLKEIPDIQELIYAVHSIEFPYNKYSSASLDGMTFVEYELFLMDKSMKKYGDSKGDYFKKLDGDYEERFTNPAKQGFTNHFEAPVILYNDDAYSVSGTYFWTSDEHEPRRMSFFPIDDINDDEKFITLTDEDMKSVPKIKDAIASIGTIKESVSASKGLPEDQWNQYREWFKQKSQDSLNSDRFRLIQYDNHLYSIGFGIC